MQPRAGFGVCEGYGEGRKHVEVLLVEVRAETVSSAACYDFW